MKNTILLLLTTLLAGCLISCKDGDEPGVYDDGNIIRKVWLRETGYTGTGLNKGEPAFGSFSAYLFTDSVLSKVYSGLTVDPDGGCAIEVVRTPDTRLYFLANADEIVDNNYTVGATTERSFLSSSTLAFDTPERSVEFATGKIDVPVSGNLQPEVVLKRGVARLDIEIAESGSQLESISIAGLACGSYLFPQAPVSTPASIKKGDLNQEYDAPVTGAKEGICYLYEQPGGQEVSLVSRLYGIQHTLKVQLPEVIQRNHTYRIRITGVGATLKAVVDVSEWEAGPDIEATPDLSRKVKVDLEQSVLSDGVRVSENKDTLYVPYYGGEFQLALENADADVLVSGEGVVIAPSTATRTDYEGSLFNVDVALQYPGSPENYVYLDVRNRIFSETIRDRIVIAIGRSATTFSGTVSQYFRQTTTSAISEYMDGDLGFIQTGEENVVTCDAEWIRLEKTETQGYRIIGGYRPNDPEADGRIQTAAIVVTHPGGAEEAYTVTRPNTGLPVVLIKSDAIEDTYWCKFNLRGNSRNVEDQISLSHPAAQAEDLYEYLKNCTDEEYMEVMGDAYKGKNTTGLKLMYTGTGNSRYAYRNYATTSTLGSSISTSNPKAQCPPGYEVPKTTDYAAIFPKTDLVFSEPDREVDYETGLSENAHVSWYERTNVAYDGDTIPRLLINEIQINPSANASSPLVLFSTGHQWDNTNMGFTYTLLGSIGDNKQWGCGTFIKLDIHNDNKTKTLRCIKSKFGFIY